MPRVPRAVPLLLLAINTVSAPALGQSPVLPARDESHLAAATPADSSDLVPLFGWRDAAIAVGFGVATVILFQVDRHVALQAQERFDEAVAAYRKALAAGPLAAEARDYAQARARALE